MAKVYQITRKLPVNITGHAVYTSDILANCEEDAMDLFALDMFNLTPKIEVSLPSNIVETEVKELDEE